MIATTERALASARAELRGGDVANTAVRIWDVLALDKAICGSRAGAEASSDDGVRGLTRSGT